MFYWKIITHFNYAFKMNLKHAVSVKIFQLV